MAGPQCGVVEFAADKHLGPALHERLNLRLPLLRPDEARRRELGQNFLDRVGAAQQFVERAAAGHPFAALRGEDQCAALLQHSGTGAHAFHTLVQIKIQRVAAVCGDDDVERLLDGLHRRFFDERAAGFVRLNNVAGKHVRDVALFVERDVEEKSRPGLERDVAQLLPKWVALGDAKRRLRVADVFRAVIAHHCFQAGATRHDALHASAEPGKKMRLDKPGDDSEIGLDDLPVEQRRRAVRRGSDLHERLRVFRLVIEHAIVGNDFRREHGLQFLPRVGTVRAELVQQRDVVAWPAEMLKQPRDDSVVRCRAGDVGKGDADFCVRRDAFKQRLAADRFLQRIEQGCLFIGQAVDVRRLDDRRSVVGNLNGKMAGAVCQVDCHS